MKILAINGSPRKNGNTGTLLAKAMDGAKSQGAETEIIHLYDLQFKGCISCFACKRINGKSYGKCALKDDLSVVLEKIDHANAFVLGSPIYLTDITGEMRSFIERLAFQYLVYDKERTVLTPNKVDTGFIYTMNLNEQIIKELEYEHIFKRHKNLLERFFGNSETLVVTDTYQFDDYSKYVSTMFDETAKAERRNKIFPIDCQEAFNLGVKLVANVK